MCSQAKGASQAPRIEGNTMSDYYDKETGEEISEADMHERFAEMLDETCEPVTVAGLTFQPSNVLKSTDPIAFRVYAGDYVSAEIGETIVESGFWVDVLTEDGEIAEAREWFADEDDARDRFEAFVEETTDAAAAGTVRLYDTSDDMIAEHTVTVTR